MQSQITKLFTEPKLKANNSQAQTPQANNSQTKNPLQWLILALIPALMQACSVMPYKESSSCQYNDLGKCISISDAYSEAIKKPQSLNNASLDAQANNYSLTSTQNYQDLLHKKIQSIISLNEIPLLRPAVVRRVLINSYKSDDSRTWSEPRHIYYIEKTPQWIFDSPHQHRAKDQNYLNF